MSNKVYFISFLDSSEDESDDGSVSNTEETEGEDVNVPAVAGLWLPVMGEDPGPAPLPFTGVPGPKHAPPANSKPISYLDLFFPEAFMADVCKEINRYAEQYIQGHQEFLRNHPRSRVHLWIKQGPVTVVELRAFLGLAYNMGLNKKPVLDAYWDMCHPSQFIPFFPQHFNRDRFMLILKFLHFANNEEMPPPTSPNYRTYKVQLLVDHFRKAFRHFYHPGKDISIDESMVGYKGKTPHLRQYMPNKRHARFGIKLWCLCDAKNGYLSFFEIFKGAHADQDKAEKEGATFSLVMRMMTESKLLYLGHHLGLDNYFSSPALFQALLAKSTSATGTVRKNRKGLPKVCLKTKLKNQEVCERRKGDLLCVAFKDGKGTPVLLSTASKAGYTEFEKDGQAKRKPSCVLLYNKTMGGVDLSDARLYCYLAERRTMKWTSKLAFSLFGRAALNAYILYAESTSDKPVMTRYKFMISLVESLSGDYYPPKVLRKRRTAAQIEAAQAGDAVPPPLEMPQEPQPGPSTDPHTIEKLPKGKLRQCVAGHDKRVRSAYQCPACDVGLCVVCFVPYHKKMKKQ